MRIIKFLHESWKEYLLIIVGSIITAVAINIFLVPYKIAPGGVTGIATVIFYLTDGRFSVGLTMLLLNIPLFILGIKFIGGKFFVRTLFGTVFLSLSIDFLQPFASHFANTYLSKLESVSTTPDLLLYSIFGGFIMGIGLGLVFKSGATTGGTDLGARIIVHFIPSFTMGQVLLIVDALIVLFAAITFKSFLLALYAIVTLFISSKVIDAILEGVNFAKALFIISDEPDEISKRIMLNLDRGVTALKGKGKYTGSDKEVLFCVIHRAQMPQLKEIVKEVDKKAFIVLTDIREVLGEGFKTYD